MPKRVGYFNLVPQAIRLAHPSWHEDLDHPPSRRKWRGTSVSQRAPPGFNRVSKALHASNCLQDCSLHTYTIHLVSPNLSCSCQCTSLHVIRVVSLSKLLVFFSSDTNNCLLGVCLVRRVECFLCDVFQYSCRNADKIESPTHITRHSFRKTRQLITDVLLESVSSPSSHFLYLSV